MSNRENRVRPRLLAFAAAACCGLLSASWSAAAQDADPPPAPPTEGASADGTSTTRPAAERTVHGFEGGPRAGDAPAPSAVETLLTTAGPSGSGVAFYPDLAAPALNWFAVVVILLLSFRARPIFCWRNLDGVMLALAALLLLFRPDAANALVAGTARTWQWWGYTGLAAVTVYWLLRGAGLVFSRRAVAGDCNVSEGAMLALILAALGIGFGTIVTAPLSAGARDGVVGGLQFLHTGKLPYGDAPGHDSRSPLVYLAHAGAMKLSKPTMTGESGTIVPLTADNRDRWVGTPWADTADLTSVRIVNGSLYVLVLLGLLVIGSRLHSTAIGLTVFVLFAVFPGAVECLTQPDVMLPAALLTWAVACALLPGVGGLLSGLLVVLAGAAWPWAWLALPVFLAYFMRRGAQGPGAILGALVGAAAIVLGIVSLTAPSLPRANGALSAAGRAPGVAARADELGDIEFTRIEPPGPASSDFKSWIWKFLLNGEEVKVRPRAAAPGEPAFREGAGVTLATTPVQSMQADAAALPALQKEYRAVLQGQSAMVQSYAALRTVLESTWLPVGKAPSAFDPQWRVWLGERAAADRVTMIRRGVKLAAGVLGLLVAAAIFFGRRNRPRHLLGGLLAVGCAALLADAVGAAANLAWLIPLVLCLWAMDDDGEPVRQAAAVRAAPPANFGGRAPAPRITIEG